METVTVYYQDNRNPGLEGQIYDSARSFQAKIKQEFSFDNGVFQALIEFKNNGQVENFKKDLDRLGLVFKIKVSLGGFLS